MKLILKTTQYWLFEETNSGSGYYYIRCRTVGSKVVSWFMGYENKNGVVCSLGPELTDEKKAELESRFLKTPASEVEFY